MLSLNGGASKMCVPCFEKKGLNVDELDSHDHAPFTPESFVPFHPFTKRYAEAHMFDSSGSEYEDDTTATTKKKSTGDTSTAATATLSEKPTDAATAAKPTNAVTATVSAKSTDAGKTASSTTDVVKTSKSTAAAAAAAASVVPVPPTKKTRVSKDNEDTAASVVPVPPRKKTRVSKDNEDTAEAAKTASSTKKPTAVKTSKSATAAAASVVPVPPRKKARVSKDNEDTAEAAEAAATSAEEYSAKKTKNKVKKTKNKSSTVDLVEDTAEEEEEDDGVRLDKNLIETPEVKALLVDREYVVLAKMTAKARALDKKKKDFRKMRNPVRVSAAAARKAYVNAAEAQPDTPDVTDMLQVCNSGNIPRYVTKVTYPGNIR